MKLIHILALVTAMAAAAAAQNAGAGNASSGGQPTGGKAATATPTPSAKGSPVTRKQPGAKPPAAGAAQTPATPGGVISKKAAAPVNGGKATGTAVSATKGGAVSGAASQQHPPTSGPASATTKKGTPATTTKTGAAANPAAKAVAVPSKTGRKQAVKQTKPVATKAATPVSKTPSKTSGTAAAGTAAPPSVAPKPRMGAAGRRDPFISPIRLAGPSGPGAGCTGGKRCLSIPELVLAGTVKDISGKMMAVVVTSAKKTYTLREKDQVFNGSVERITTDSVIFREFVKDAVGRESAREVVKKVNPGPTS